MSLEFELYEEKRRKMRRFSFIRGSIVTLIVIAIGMVLWKQDIFSSPHIALYQVDGEIFDDLSRDSILSDITKDENVYGLIVRINSPGGTVVGAEALYESLKNVADRKPVIVSIGEVGASAAYLAALAGDKIFARGNSLVGSIGIIVQYPDLSKLAELIGVSLKVIKSGEVKGGTNFIEPLNENIVKNQEELVEDSFFWFKDLVSKRRNLKGEDLDLVSKGQLFTGRMALELGLIDVIGSSDEAVKYLRSKGQKFKNLKIRKWSNEPKQNFFWEKFLGVENPILGGNKIKFMQSPMLFSIAS